MRGMRVMRVVMVTRVVRGLRVVRVVRFARAVTVHPHYTTPHPHPLTRTRSVHRPSRAQAFVGVRGLPGHLVESGNPTKPEQPY